MLKELLETLNPTKEARLVIYAICITAAASYFLYDRFPLTDKGELLRQNKIDLDSLKSLNGALEQNLAGCSSKLEQSTERTKGLADEISRLQSYERAMPEWRKALDDARAQSSHAQEQLTQIGNEFREARLRVNACFAERDDLTQKVAKLNDIVSRQGALLERKNEIRELEKSKELVEVKLLELDTDSVSRPFYTEKIDHLKRLAADYQQQLLQLRQCAK